MLIILNEEMQDFEKIIKYIQGTQLKRANEAIRKRRKKIAF